MQMYNDTTLTYSGLPTGTKRLTGAMLFLATLVTMTFLLIRALYDSGALS